MATYLVTGATGFLGLHLCEQLLNAGHTVKALSRKPAPRLEEVKVQVALGDVLDEPSVAAAAKGCNAVFHLAGRVSRDPSDAADLHALHVRGTQNVVNACKAARVPRLVHCSTSGVVGVTEPPGRVLDESAQPDLTLVGKWPYYLSKIFAEQTALAAAGRDLEVVSVNPSLLLGPGDERGESTRDVRMFIQRQIPGVPQGGVSIVDARDAAHALVLALQKGRTGQRYLVTGLNTPVKDFFARLAAVSGVPAPLIPLPRSVGALSARFLDEFAKRIDGRNPLDPVSVEMASYCWYVSPEKAQSELGLEFRDPNETLHDTVEDLRQQGVKTESALPPGAGLVENILADGWRAMDKWLKKASERPNP
ncbi:MAG: NAD-dependent epimerase/dehydratase family protein [Myxococcota bacterium]